VSLVTAFEQPDVSRPEVRVVMKRAANLKPEVTRRGSLLMVDYPRTGAIAATPPVLRGDSTQTAGTTTPAPTSTEDVLASREQVISVAPTQAPASVAPAAPSAPAAIDPPAAIAILNEGGLMDGKEYVGRRISLDFKDVDVGDVLRLIAEVSDLNVIAGDEVKGKVTIRLVDVPWDQALDVILLTKGLGFIRIGNVLRIAAADVIAQEEELRLQERRAKEKLEDLVVKLQPVNYADVTDVSKMVSQLLTPRGSVNTDSRTNTLIIKDIASVIDEATALVKAVDTMTPQVMIEAKIVEASLEFSREFGSIWTFGANPLTQSTLGGRDYVFTPGASGLGNNLAFGNTITAFPNSLASIAATVLDGKFNIEAQLQAAEVNGDGKVISSPRVITLDNSEAKIEQGISIPFQTFENGDAALEFVDAVLQLKTTPHITSDKSIIMKIEVSRNAPDDSVFTLTGSPAIAKNQVKTETLVKDGQTLVLGGIYVVDKSQRQSRVPYLHKVPFLGNAFKSNEFSDSRKELLIFVTPRIVQTPSAAS
jgi:type IV pilus assembly protein PilQ